MIAVWKREFSGYFTTLIGYVYLGIFYIFSGIFFYFNGLQVQYADVGGLFLGMFSVIMYLLPVLTMRLFAEDKKWGTDQLLYTSPTSTVSIVLGKFLAAFSVYLMAISMLLVYCFVFDLYSVTSQDWGLIFSCFVGILLLGAAMISIGAFLSAITENQIIAAISTFAVSLFLNMTGSISPLLPVTWMQNAFNGLSFSLRYNSFVLGIIDISAVVFFLSLCFLFLFYCVRTIEHRRYVD